MQNKIKVLTVLFSNFELLDVFGPLEMFGMMESKFDLKLISQTGGIVKSNQGPTVVVDFSFSDEIETDILLIPGGYGVKQEIHNNIMIEWLKSKDLHSQYIVSVCTGAALLAKTGLIDNKRATTNKLDFNWVASQRAKVQWVKEARWVEDGKYFSSSGISAGMDMSLALISKLCGEETANDIARRAEYNRQKDANYDPFAKIYGLA